MHSRVIVGTGILRLREVSADHSRPHSDDVYSEWGPIDPEAKATRMARWLIELVTETGELLTVGDMSAHAVWYGPTSGSKAMNIGISIDKEFRGRGIGSAAQAILAETLHEQGFVRVEAGTDVSNTAEQRALHRAGFTFEGTARGAQVRADGRHDLQVWSHIHED